MSRSVPLAVVLLVAAGCPSNDDSQPPGKNIGEVCAAARECRSGLVCSIGRCAAVSVPSASCAAPVIVPGSPVNVADPQGSCITTARTPVLSTVNLGDHQVGTQVTFDVPAGTTSLTVFSQEVGTSAIDAVDFRGPFPNAVVPTDVREPDGTLFYSDTHDVPTDSRGYPDETGSLAFIAAFAPTMGTFTVPNTSAGLDLVRSAGELPAGQWHLTVNDVALECQQQLIEGCPVGSSTGIYDIQVLTSSRDVSSNGTLDLEIYLATDPSRSTLRSADDAVNGAIAQQVTRMVREIAAYYAQVGVCLGTVTFHDLPPWAKLRFAPSGVVDISSDGAPCNDLSQLFTLALAQKAAVHVFFADQLFQGPPTPGREVLGITGAIPGPSGVPGTVTSGLIVGLFDALGGELTPGACTNEAVSLSSCGTDVVAYATAHESGHWLGLYHTTEEPGVWFDPLSDTPTCPCLSCAPLSRRASCAELGMADYQVMEAQFCTGVSACGGARDLMFWLLDDAVSAGELTPQQGEVIRLNPAVHAP